MAVCRRKRAGQRFRFAVDRRSGILYPHSLGEMVLQRSKNRLVTLMTHVLAWGVFALAIFLYRPILSAGEIPYPFWIRQTVTLILLVIAFYVNAAVLVPGFLLKNRVLLYVLTAIALVAAVVFIHEGVDSALDASRPADQVQGVRPGGPLRRPPLAQGRHIDVLIIVIS